MIFTIVSRNYAAQAATLMRSLASAEPAARRVVVAADGPIPELAGVAEVVPAAELDAPVRDMSVYYEALELNTAVKPFVFRSLLAQAGVDSVTYLDPDIYVFRAMTAVREALGGAPLCLIPHVTRPLTTPGNPTNEDLERSGRFNLGFLAARRDPQVAELLDWWAERCRFDCRVDLKAGLFTDQKWMDRAPEFVPEAAILGDPGLNLAYWNLEGRSLVRGPDGWLVDGEPLVFFHFSGFDPDRPRALSKHQNRLAVRRGSPLAALLAFYARALKTNGHKAARAKGYGFDRFASGRRVTRAMRRRALRAARAGETFPDGLGAATEAWMDAVDPDAARPGLPDLTRIMDQAWRDSAADERFDPDTAAGRLLFARWFVDNAAALGADAASAEAARRILEESGPPDLETAFAGDPDGLLAWRVGPEAAAGRFRVDALPQDVLARLAAEPALLERAAAFAETDPEAGELRRRLFLAFGLSRRAAWPERLAAPLRVAHLAPARDLHPPFVQAFADIWAARSDLQRLYPLNGLAGRFRYLRWLIAGGFAEYGVEMDALPPHIRRHPLMRLAEFSVRRRAAG